MTEWSGKGVPQIPLGATIRVKFRDGHETVSRYGDETSPDWAHTDGYWRIRDIVGYEVLPQGEGYYQIPGGTAGAECLRSQPGNADVEWADYSASRELVAKQTERALGIAPASPGGKTFTNLLVQYDDAHDALTFHDLGNTDANGEGKETNPKDLVGSRKAPLSTLPFRVLWRVGLAMLEGMCKYGRHNYRIAGVRASVYFDGAMRHLGAWWEGEDVDADSGFSHIDKLIADLMVLRDSMLQGNWVDDRPPSVKEDMPALHAEAARIVDLHKDKTPRHFTIADTRRAA